MIGYVAERMASPAPTADCLIDLDVTVVTYCWGPGCDGATRATLEFAKLGSRFKEIIGGYEYSVREGVPVATADGVSRRPVDR